MKERFDGEQTASAARSFVRSFVVVVGSGMMVVSRPFDREQVCFSCRA